MPHTRNNIDNVANTVNIIAWVRVANRYAQRFIGCYCFIYSMPKTPKVQYSKENLQKAIEAVQDASNNLSTRQIAEKYCVPRSSLRYYIKNPGHKTSLGPSPILTVSEESRLEDWIIISARKGFPRNKEDILDSVQKFLGENPRPNSFLKNRPGDGWWKAFLKRHPKLAIRTSEGVTKASSCVAEKDIRGWFTEIQNYIAEKDLTSILSAPDRIFNADETNFQICVKSGQVLAEKGARNVYNVEQSQAKESITVLFTFSAAGNVCCPFIVYPYQRLPEKISESVPDGWGIGKSDTGWMTTEVFYEFIANVFHPYLLSNNIELPVILYVDGHKTHLNFHLSQLCTHLQIELIALYPNATRILQPADVAAFRPLKVGWRKTLRKWQNDHNNQGVTKLNFAPVLNEAVMMSLKPEILVNGFKACGLYPFNPDAINYEKCLGATSLNTATKNKIPVSDSTTINYSTFKNIIGPSIKDDFENRHRNMPHQEVTEHLDILYQVWKAFHDADTTNNTNHHEVSLPVVTPQKQKDDLNELDDLRSSQAENIFMDASLDFTSSMPEVYLSKDVPMSSTSLVMSASSSLQLPSPIIVKKKCSLGEYLAYPETPIRKGKRKTERQPYAISSKNFKAALHMKQKEKENLLKVKEEKKLIKEKKKTENANTKSKKKVSETVKSKEIDTSLEDNSQQLIEPFEQQLEPTPKKIKKEIGIKSKEMSANKKITIFSNLLIQPSCSNILPKPTCGVCHFNVIKNELTCSVCSKIFHVRCIPPKHKEHIPDYSDLDLFLCHRCFEVDDSNCDDSDSSTSAKEMFDMVNKAKRNLF